MSSGHKQVEMGWRVNWVCDVALPHTPTSY